MSYNRISSGHTYGGEKRLSHLNITDYLTKFAALQDLWHRLMSGISPKFLGAMNVHKVIGYGKHKREETLSRNRALIDSPKKIWLFNMTRLFGG